MAVLIIFVSVNKTKNHTAETTATITSIGTCCGSGNTVVHFKYTVSGAGLENWTCYDHSQIMKANYKINSQATACYETSDPKDSSVVPIAIAVPVKI